MLRRVPSSSSSPLPHPIITCYTAHPTLHLQLYYLPSTYEPTPSTHPHRSLSELPPAPPEQITQMETFVCGRDSWISIANITIG